MKIKYQKEIAILLVGFLTFISCQDDPLKVGLNILPEGDNLELNADTLDIRCSTVNFLLPNYSSSAGTNKNKCLIGHVFDPVFGETKASTVVQLNRGTNLYKKDTANINDSIIDCYLYLNSPKTNNTYGIADSTIYNVDIVLYPLRKAMRYGISGDAPTTDYKIKSDDYDFNTVISDQSALTAMATIDSSAFEAHSFPIDTGQYIIVKLQNSYGKLLMDEALISNSNFLTNFPGLYLDATATDATGGLRHFDYNKSKLVVKYSRKKSKSDSTIFFTHTLSRFQSFYKHDNKNFEAGAVLDDTSANRDYFHIQSLDGVKGYVELTGLKEQKEKYAGKVGINFAELVFPVNADNPNTKSFPVPPRITIKEVVVPGSLIRGVIDAEFQPQSTSSSFTSAYFGGFYDEEESEYRLNITEFVTSYLNDNNDFYNNKLYLFSGVNNAAVGSFIEYTTPNRVVLNTGTNTDKKAYLRIIYTLNQN